jgi:hypothetical protein
MNRVCTTKYKHNSVCTTKYKHKSVCTTKHKHKTVCAQPSTNTKVCAQPSTSSKQFVHNQAQAQNSVCTTKHKHKTVCAQPSTSTKVCAQPSTSSKQCVHNQVQVQNSVCTTKHKHKTVCAQPSTSTKQEFTSTEERAARFQKRSQNCETWLSASSCLFICPSVRMTLFGSYWTDFHEIWYLRIFRKSVEKIQFLSKSDNNKGYFTWRQFYIFIISGSFLLRMRNVSEIRCREDHKTHFYVP